MHNKSTIDRIADHFDAKIVIRFCGAPDKQTCGTKTYTNKTIEIFVCSGRPGMLHAYTIYLPNNQRNANKDLRWSVKPTLHKHPKCATPQTLNALKAALIPIGATGRIHGLAYDIRDTGNSVRF